MNRIDQAFDNLRKKKKKAFIAYLTAGDPDLNTTEKLVPALEKAGVNIIELGVPFSDPMADGPTIQAASQRALDNGVTMRKILAAVKRIRKSSDIPIALMTYYNPVYHFGEKRFVGEASRCGVDGVIIPDLPPEEAKGLISEARKKGLSTVFFMAPTTPVSRLPRIAQASTGFIYYVSLTGVTGARKRLDSSYKKQIQAARKVTTTPICVGFGISSADQVRKISKAADGVIVGSAIVNKVAQYGNSRAGIEKVSRFVRNLTRGLAK